MRAMTASPASSSKRPGNAHNNNRIRKWSEKRRIA